MEDWLELFNHPNDTNTGARRETGGKVVEAVVRVWANHVVGEHEMQLHDWTKIRTRARKAE